MYLIAGLGNPGVKYEATRHNYGFLAVDYFAMKHKIKVNKLKYKGLVGWGKIFSENITLLKPQTFMNLSGVSVKSAYKHLDIPINKLIIIYDDMDLNLGSIRIKPKGGAGSHNGMKSIIYQLESDEFTRIRLGIGRPLENYESSSYVLSQFNNEERVIVKETLEKTCEAIECIINKGINEGMTAYNTK